LWGFPLLTLAGIRWFQKPTLFRAGVMGLLLAALLLTDPYFLLIGVFLWGTILVVVVGWQWRIDGWYPALRQLGQGLAGTLWAPVLIMGYEYIAGRVTGDEYLKSRQTVNVSEVYLYAARWFEFIDPPAVNPYLGSASVRLISGTFHLNMIGEGPLFVGFVTLGLAGGYVVYALWRRAALTATEGVAFALGLAAAAVGVVMSLSTRHAVAGVSIPPPAELIFRIQPGWRVYSRFIVIVVFGVLVLAVLALDRLTARLPPWARPILIAAVVGASYVELAYPLPVLKIGPTPSGYVALAKLDRGAILAEYPMAEFDDVATHQYMYWQTIHHHPMVNDAPLGSRADAFREDILALRDPTVPLLLAFMGVRLVTIHDATVPGAGLEAVDPGAGLQPRIYRVTAVPADGIALFRTGVDASVVGSDGRVERWIVGSPASVDVIVRHSGVYGISAAVTAFPTARTMVVSGPDGSVRVPITDHQTVVHFHLGLASGTNAVTLRTVPSAGAASGDPRRLLMGNWVISGPSHR
jgi:hypothetical protein